MFQNIKYLLLSIFVSTTVFAQALPIRNDTPSNLRDLGSNLQVGKNFSVDQKGRMWTISDPVAGTVTHTNPSINNSTSTTLVAANASRRWLSIQNNSAANVCFSLTGATLTGIVPSGTNLCDVLIPNAVFTTPVNYMPTGAVTIFQTSGGAITSISVNEG